jgi:mRNA interferase RelE/StbE
MEVVFSIVYHELVIKEDIPCLPADWKRNIQKSIEKKLIIHPAIYGKPLRKSLRGYRKLRVGDYRVIFRIEKRTVKIFIIQHRSVVYRHAKKRL